MTASVHFSLLEGIENWILLSMKLASLRICGAVRRSGQGLFTSKEYIEVVRAALSQVSNVISPDSMRQLYDAWVERSGELELNAAALARKAIELMKVLKISVQL